VAVPVVKYALEITTSAQKKLDALDDLLFERIDRKILSLADDPRPVGSKKLKGFKDSWRIRVGDWRVVYIVNDAAKLVRIPVLLIVEKSTQGERESTDLFRKVCGSWAGVTPLL
jgi:mRNA interferase RelE/StbE